MRLLPQILVRYTYFSNIRGMVGPQWQCHSGQIRWKAQTHGLAVKDSAK